MKLALAILLCLLGSGALAQEKSLPSAAGRLFLEYEAPVPKSRDAEARANAARRFLASLDEKQRLRAALAIDDPERRQWTNVPPSRRAGGLPFSSCSEDQLKRLCDLVATVTSSRGYRRVREIVIADDRLLGDTRPRGGLGAAHFRVALFGTPSATEAWGLQIDGHHLALNLSFKGEQMTLSPSFFGTQPAAFRMKRRKFRPLGDQDDASRALIVSLTPEQRKRAVTSTGKGNLKTGPGTDGKRPKPEGIACSEFSKEQTILLRALVTSYLGDLPEPFAKRRIDEVMTDSASLRFSWQGATLAASDVSYRLIGPTLIIDFACQDFGGDPLQHLHAMVRDPSNEYGSAFPASRTR